MDIFVKIDDLNRFLKASKTKLSLRGVGERVIEMKYNPLLLPSISLRLELKEIYDNLYNGKLTPALEKSLKLWINANLESLIADAMKMVFFGLTEDGYFVAYIPDSWSEITFGTSGLDDFPANVDFGHLTLSY